MALKYVVTSPLSLSEPSLLKIFSTGGFIDLKPPSTLPNNYNFVLPPNIGNNGEYLTTDGSGNCSWTHGPSTITSVDVLSTFDTIPFTTTSTTYITVPGTSLDISTFYPGNSGSGYGFSADFHCDITGVGGTVYDIALFTTSEALPRFFYRLTIDSNAPTNVSGLVANNLSTSSDILSISVRIVSGTSITITNRFLSAYQIDKRF